MSRPSPTPRRSRDHWVPKVAVVLAVVGTATIVTVAVVQLDDGDALSVRSAPTTSSTTSTTSTTVEITIPDTVPPTTLPETTTTIEETTTVVETVPPTEPPAPPVTETLPPPNLAATPTVPFPEVFSGPGSPQIMNEPLPSGLSVTTMAPAFAEAQRLADILATRDWAAARQILVVDDMDDPTFEARYAPSDRISLLLLNATPSGVGFNFTFGAVSNDVAGNQTTLRCFHWYADDVAVDILDESVVQTYPLLFSPEDLRNDPTLDRTAREGCL